MSAGMQIVNDGEHLVVTIDASGCNGLWKVLEPEIAQGRRTVVIDLGQVEYLNSMNIAAIVSARNRLQVAGGRMALANLGPQLASIFRILKLERIFTLDLDLAAAKASVVSGPG